MAGARCGCTAGSAGPVLDRGAPPAHDTRMTTAIEADPMLASMLDELRSQLAALNQLHHPVVPGDPRRIAELERRIAELRAAIALRRRGRTA